MANVAASVQAAKAGEHKGGPLRVFISYSRADIDFADQLYAALELYGYDASMDRHEVSAGEDWKSRLSNLIREADTIAFVLSPASASSSICAWEVDEAARLGKRILPVVCRPLEGVQPPQRLADKNYIFFYPDKASPDTGFGTGLVQLTTALNTDLDWLREHTRLLVRATEWENAGRVENRMLSGDQIAQAKSWAARRPANAPEPTPLHLDFIRASEAAEDARRNAEAQRLVEMAAAQDERAKALADAEIALTSAAEAQKGRARAQRFIAWISGVSAVVLAGVAVFAGFQWRTANAEKKRAEQAVSSATEAARSLIADFTDANKLGKDVPRPVVRQIVNQARGIMDKLVAGGEASPETDLAYGMEKGADLLTAEGDKTGALTELEKALTLRKKIMESRGAETKSVKEFVTLLRRIAKLRAAAGDKIGAFKLVEQAESDAERRAVETKDFAWRLCQVRILDVEIDLHTDAGEMQNAQAVNERIVALLDGLKSIEATADWQELSFEALQGALVLQTLAKLPADSIEKMLALAERRAAAEPENIKLQRAIADVQIFRAVNLFMTGDRAGAIAVFEKATREAEKNAKSRDGSYAMNRTVVLQERDLELDIPDAILPLFAALAEISKEHEEKLAAADPANAAQRAYLANSYARVGAIRLKQKDRAAGFTYYDKALAINETLVAAEPANSEFQNALMAKLRFASRAHQSNGDYPGGIALLEKALLLGEKLASQQPTNVSRQNDLCDLLSDLAYEKAISDRTGAQALFERAVEIREKLAAADPADAAIQNDLAWDYSRLAEHKQTGHNLAGATRGFEKALAIREKRVATELNNKARQSSLAYALSNLANVKNESGEGDEARVLYERAVAISEQVAADEPGDTSLQLNLATRLIALSDAKRDGGDTAGALAVYEKVLAVREKLAAAEPATADRHSQLGDANYDIALLRASDPDSARTALAKALEAHEKAAAMIKADEVKADGKPGISTADALRAVAMTALMLGENEKALAAAERAYGLDAAWLPNVRIRAHALMLSGRADEARTIYLGHLGERNSLSDTKTWEQNVAKNFEEFRKAGIDHPLMAEIESAFKPPAAAEAQTPAAGTQTRTAEPTPIAAPSTEAPP